MGTQGGGSDAQADQHEETATKTDEKVRAQSRGLVTDLPFHPIGKTENEGQSDPDQCVAPVHPPHHAGALHDRRKDIIHGDAAQAPRVSLPAKPRPVRRTGPACQVVLEDLVVIAERAEAEIENRRPEDGHDRNPKSNGEMHHSRIVRDQCAATFEEPFERAQRRADHSIRLLDDAMRLLELYGAHPARFEDSAERIELLGRPTLHGP